MRLRRAAPDDQAQRLARLLNPPSSDPVPSPVSEPAGWTVNRPVEPRPETDRLHGWVPEPPPDREGRRRGRPAQEDPPPREMDELDRFLASAGLDGLTDVDGWNEADPYEERDGWWSRLSIPWRAAVAVVVLGAVVVAVLGVRSLTAPSPGTGVAVPVRVSGAATTAATAPVAATAGAAATGSAAVSSGPGRVIVDVVGQVKRPGVVKLASGSRVADAVTAAGGLTAGADVASVNLARVLQDGEQLRIPRPGESPSVAATAVAPTAGVGAATTGAATATGAAPGTAAGGVVNLNTATLAELDSLDGIGPALAQRILDYRTAHGNFTSVDQLDDVSGIGEKMLAKLRPQVTV